MPLSDILVGGLSHSIMIPSLSSFHPKVTEVPLLTAGETKRVNDMNKKEFVYLAAKRHCIGGADLAISAIRSGISDVIQKNLLSILLPSEVGWLLCLVFDDAVKPLWMRGE